MKMASEKVRKHIFLSFRRRIQRGITSIRDPVPSANGRPPGLRFPVFSGTDFTGVTAFHKAIEEKGFEKEC
jgi:hypothetical protein